MLYIIQRKTGYRKVSILKKLHIFSSQLLILIFIILIPIHFLQISDCIADITVWC